MYFSITHANPAVQCCPQRGGDTYTKLIYRSTEIVRNTKSSFIDLKSSKLTIISSANTYNHFGYLPYT